MYKQFFTLVVLLVCTGLTAQQRITPGAERLGEYVPLLKGRAVAIFANPTSMVGNTHLIDTLRKLGVNIKKIFAPEHGFRGTADAGEKVESTVDEQTGIPVISLYGKHNKPTPEELADVDVMIFDIQDVGVRFYTYISSLQLYLEAAILNKKTLLLLDRPNPNGFYVDGPVLEKKFKSFVGMQPIPIVYGMTMGEYAWMLLGETWYDSSLVKMLDTKKILKQFNRKTAFSPGVFSLQVIPCKNYTHDSLYVLPVKPSPNLPNNQSIYLYPSICFFEGTQVSLGRGTDKPFQCFGHPSFPQTLYSFTPRSLPGAKNPPLLNQTCYGYDVSNINVVKTSNKKIQLRWLIMAYNQYREKDSFFLKNNFFNKLAGNDVLMQQIKSGATEMDIRASWEPALQNFKRIRKKYLLYKDFNTLNAPKSNF